METITFEPVDSATGKMNNCVMTIKAEFAEKVPNFRELPTKELVETHQVFNFLHNPNGPAMIDRKQNPHLVSYFIDAQLIEPGTEEFNKIKHREGFNSGMDKLLAPEETVKTVGNL